MPRTIRSLENAVAQLGGVIGPDPEVSAILRLPDNQTCEGVSLGIQPHQRGDSCRLELYELESELDADPYEELEN